MRNLQLEAALWYFVTSPEFYEMAAAECEDTMEWFGNLAISRGVVNYGRNNQVYDAFKKAARNFRRGAEMARLGDYSIAQAAADGVSSDIRGMMEQPFQSWMTADEFKEFESKRIGKLLAYEFMVNHGLNNAITGAEIFYNPDKDYPETRDRDDGFPDDEIVKWYRNYVNSKYKAMQWHLPDPLLQYVIDSSRTCRTGDEVPWTGVWYPETGLERYSLTFAIKGLRMQPAYQVIKTEEELRIERNAPWLCECETKAVATTWHPVIPVSQFLQTNNGMMRVKAGEPCPQAGLWQSLDAKGEKRAYKQGDIMADLGSAYGFTIWQYVGEN